LARRLWWTLPQTASVLLSATFGPWLGCLRKIQNPMDFSRTRAQPTGAKDPVQYCLDNTEGVRERLPAGRASPAIAALLSRNATPRGRSRSDGCRECLTRVLRVPSRFSIPLKRIELAATDAGTSTNHEADGLSHDRFQIVLPTAYFVAPTRCRHRRSGGGIPTVSESHAQSAPRRPRANALSARRS